MNLRRLLTLGLLACSVASAAARWDSVYFYDHATEVLEFLDIAAPSAQRIIAVGSIHDTIQQKKDRHVAVVTSDSGSTWQQVKLEDEPVSLFFLNDSLGWMVTDRGIWKTDESGRSWTRVSKHPSRQILRLWFLDADHGFAVGSKKTVVETKDGGRTWTKVPGAQTGQGDPNLSFYTRVAFVNSKSGIILGTQLSSVSSLFPGMNRGRALSRMLQLQTSDGGITWTPAQGLSGGLVNGIKFSGEQGLVLINFADTRGRDVSNVFLLPLRRNQQPSVLYESKDLQVTDIGFFPNHAFVAGVDTAKNRQLEALPRKVRILESAGPYKLWNEIEVAYDAEATHLTFAGSDADHAFVATDTGMILRLQR